MRSKRRPLTDSRWVDVASWLLYPAFALAAVMQPVSETTAVLAGGLFVLLDICGGLAARVGVRTKFLGRRNGL